MNSNTCLLYNNVHDVYHKLILFCIAKDFRIKESNEKYYFLRAKKSSLLFWKNLRLELEILTADKEKVQVTAMLYKFGKRQPALESEYIISIEKFLNAAQEG